MTTTPARVTAAPDGLLAAVAERYAGGAYRLVRPLEGGWANDVFLVESEDGNAVLRRKHPPSDDASIGWEHGVVARIAGEVPEALPPLHARDGSTFFLFGGAAVWLVPWVDGSPADRARDAHRVAAARLLGRLHAATASLEVEQRPGVEGLLQLRSLAVGELPPRWRRRVAVLHADALRLLDSLDSRPLEHGVVHGDFFRGNVLMSGDDVAALVDWEEAHVAPYVSELANGIWEFAKSKVTHDFERDAARRFAATYRDFGGRAAAGDDELIVPLIRAKRVLELLRAPSDRFVDWEYQEHNLLAAERLA